MTEHQSVQYKINDKINYKSRPCEGSQQKLAEAQKPPSINKQHNAPVGGRRALICTLCSVLTLAGNTSLAINMGEVRSEDCTVFQASLFHLNEWSSLILSIKRFSFRLRSPVFISQWHVKIS